MIKLIFALIFFGGSALFAAMALNSWKLYQQLHKPIDGLESVFFMALAVVSTSFLLYVVGI